MWNTYPETKPTENNEYLIVVIKIGINYIVTVAGYNAKDDQWFHDEPRHAEVVQWAPLPPLPLRFKALKESELAKIQGDKP